MEATNTRIAQLKSKAARGLLTTAEARELESLKLRAHFTTKVRYF